MAVLKLSLLGSFTAELDSQPLDTIGTTKAQALLIYLVVEKDRAHTREYLFTLLWPGMPESSARHNLRQVLYSLNKSFLEFPSRDGGNPIPILLTDRRTIQLNPEAVVEVDIHRLKFLNDQYKNHDHSNLSYCNPCLYNLLKVAELYKGDFLADFYLEDSNLFEDWAEAVREDYRNLALDVLSTLVDIYIANQDYSKAKSYIDRQLDIDNLRENAHRQLIEVFALSGRRVEALRHYREYAEVLKNELEIEPSKIINEIYKRIRREDVATLGPITITKSEPITPPRNNLPAQPTSFIGRESELDQLDELLNDPNTRLITIVGPGGIGKTRLAIACAEQQVQEMVERVDSHVESDSGGIETYPYGDGIFFVDLTLLSEINQIILNLAESFDIRLVGVEGKADTLRQQLLDYLRDKRMLLIIDNFEHLLSRVDLVADIIDSSTGVQILLTSRERLHLQQEQLFPISGLNYPDWETPEDTIEYSAVQLFLSAARRIRPDFDLSSADLTHLIRICQMVDGMPLALELAAGWVELLPLAEISKEINRSLSFLETELRGMPDRHRSMRAVFESTWTQLGTKERDLMQRLSVFQGGFKRDAARQVATDEQESTMTLKLLVRLVSKSLLHYSRFQDRYHVHELLRQYVWEKLNTSEQIDAIRTAHANYYINLLIQREADIKGGREQKSALDEIEADFLNIQSAWDWTLSLDDLDAINQSMEALSWFCWLRNHEYEGVELCIRAEAKFALDSDRVNLPIWRWLVARRIFLDTRVQLFEKKDKLIQIETILDVARSKMNQVEIAFALFAFGTQKTPNFQASLENWEESQLIYHVLGDIFSESYVLDFISLAYLNLGQPEKRAEIAQQRFEMARKMGDRLTMADAMSQIGFIAEMNGRYKEAKANFTEAIPVFREFGDRFHTCEYIFLLGQLAILDGDYERAKSLVAEGLRLVRQFNVQRSIGYKAFMLQAVILSIEEQYDQAAQLFQDNPTSEKYNPFEFIHLLGLAYAMCGMGDFSNASEHLTNAMETAKYYKATGWQVQCLPTAALLAAGNDQLERAAELLALATHHPTSTREWLSVFPLVSRLNARLEAELPKEVFTDAWKRGKNLDLDKVIATLLSEYKEISSIGE